MYPRYDLVKQEQVVTGPPDIVSHPVPRRGGGGKQRQVARSFLKKIVRKRPESMIFLYWMSNRRKNMKNTILSLTQIVIMIKYCFLRNN